MKNDLWLRFIQRCFQITLKLKNLKKKTKKNLKRDVSSGNLEADSNKCCHQNYWIKLFNFKKFSKLSFAFNIWTSNIWSFSVWSFNKTNHLFLSFFYFFYCFVSHFIVNLLILIIEPLVFFLLVPFTFNFNLY